MQVADALLQVIIFWLLTTPHEFAHAWVADRLGDDTPRKDGRVTLNPMAHVDWMGTVILPLVTVLLGGLFFGWGRPVMTNTSRLRGGYTGLMLVAMAGPASNVIFAVVLATLAAFIPSAAAILLRASVLSLYLALFNLIPIPPLDGSKLLLAAKIPPAIYIELSRFGFILLMIVMFSTGLGQWMYSTSQLVAFSVLSIFRG
jgi:Zn-dependent protease